MSELPNAADSEKPEPWFDLRRDAGTILREAPRFAAIFIIGTTLSRHFLGRDRAAVSSADILVRFVGSFTAGAILSLFKLRSTKQTLRNRPTV